MVNFPKQNSVKVCRRVDIFSSFILWPVYLHENSLWYVLEELVWTWWRQKLLPMLRILLCSQSLLTAMWPVCNRQIF